MTALASRGDEGVWQPTTWRGEEAYESRSGGWHAIVSVARARLVHFGATADDRNLLFETATRDHPQGWGGHRVWLGPQGTWPSGWWPPPPEWESTAAERATVREDVLELQIQSAGHGWPRWTRTYHWEGDSLVCGVDVHADGTVPAQVIHILQVPTEAIVELRLVPDDLWPEGYAGLKVGDRRDTKRLTNVPPHARISGDRMTLRHTGAVEKLGFRPQPIHARIGNHPITVDRGQVEGRIAGNPDEGFFTQVYLGHPDAFIELEQLSPLWKPGIPARSELVIRGRHEE